MLFMHVAVATDLEAHATDETCEDWIWRWRPGSSFAFGHGCSLNVATLEQHIKYHNGRSVAKQIY